MVCSCIVIYSGVSGMRIATSSEHKEQVQARRILSHMNV
nr:MAG TPA: hypothetical protein [Caudoviricetes sp.]